jgi:hypothetical protein
MVNGRNVKSDSILPPFVNPNPQARTKLVALGALTQSKPAAQTAGMIRRCTS